MTGATGQSRAYALVGLAVALALAFAVFLWTRDDDPAPRRDAVASAPAPDIPAPAVAPAAAPPAVIADDVTPATTVEAVEAVETMDPAPTPPPPDPAAPAVDVVRIEPGGGALVAGRAPAGSEIVLRVDGAEVGSATVDARGDFVAFTELAPTEAPRVLTVETLDAAAPAVSDAIIVAPTAAAVAAGAEAHEALDPSTESAPTLALAPPQAPVAPDDGPDAATLPGTPAATTAPTTPRLFRIDAEGVSAFPGDVARDPAGRPAPALGLDAISYDAAGDVVLAGRGGTRTDLRIYLDNRPVQSTRIGEGGAWRSPLPDVDEGVYTLRIDALDETGAVTSRIETPFQRVAPPASGAADGGTTVVTVQPGSTLWGISERYFGDGAGRRFVQIFEANRDLIRDPDLIYPGQVFTLPGPAADPSDVRDG
ncbi:LysM peptidoglycan-binding domain-containing protein [Jannaschia sp. Os4]|uniref:LysM peptidoglycan-binding domain-containing protein n=1 Tax=Jannaschia sp. Os4 TaxID=2807617 RepID=UPI00193A8708|nr:LysM peptidoglycan-binding domain-containing protein [Jannaschia sp. Os4]MBM2576480.1 LysM peptidoglycan-binding domain-containing protein [Jannaschia sp. Os4]